MMPRTVKIIAFFLVICLIVPPPVICARQMTVREEKELAEEFLKTVRRNFTIIEDPVIHNYVNELGQSIVSVLPPQPFEYKFHVIDQDGVNAFAGPGGNIFIFSGLFEVMDSEGELAGIIAHEIAHVSARHIAELLEKSKKSQIVSATGMIAGILMGLGGASAVGSALAIGSAAAGQSMILAYTRENEMEADFLGRRYLGDAGYSLHGLQTALEKIRAREWYGEEEIPTYLKTHPATRERLANLNNMLADRPVAEPEDSFAFRRAQAALTGLYEDTDKAAKKLGRKISKDDTDTAAFYGLALALAQGGRPEAALEKIKKAVSLKPEDPYFKIALGRINFMAGKYREAEKTLTKIENLKDYGPEGLFYLARSRISSGDCKGAIPALETLHENFPGHKEALYFLGQCKGEQGRLGEAHYYLGMHYSKNGEFETAQFHFKRAMEKAADIKLEEKISKEMEKLRDREKESKRREREEENSRMY